MSDSQVHLDSNNNNTTNTNTTGDNNDSNNNNNDNSNSGTQQQQQQQSTSSPFECNICFDEVSEPVVTQCGHLFCWTCIFQWLHHNSSQQCPVCKSPVSKEKVIPIYGRGGSNEDPRKKQQSQSIPSRPAGRPEQPRPRNNGGGGFNDFFHSPFGSPNAGGVNVGGFSFSAGLFPGLFGVHFYGSNNNSNNGNNSNNQPNQPNTLTNEESIFFSRLMFALGLLLLFFVLFN